ncbi:hypothetical protein BaRGS_00003776, partial [Batillaria attramentaria]
RPQSQSTKQDNVITASAAQNVAGRVWRRRGSIEGTIRFLPKPKPKGSALLQSIRIASTRAAVSPGRVLLEEKLFESPPRRSFLKIPALHARFRIPREPS